MPPSSSRSRLGASDTSREIEEILVEAYRQMTPQERIARAMALTRATLELAAAGIRERHGADIPERELELRLAALRLGRETMIEVFGWDPEEKGW